MIEVKDIRAYSGILKDVAESINFERTVVDEGQIVRFLKNITRDDNNILLTVVPSASGTGGDTSPGFSNRMMFLVLKKYDSSITHEEFLEIMQNTQVSVQEIIAQMAADKEGCAFFLQFLDWNSLDINPIRSFADCHGWSIEFSFKSYL